MSAETIPFDRDEQAKSIGTAAGLTMVVGLTVKTLTAPSIHNHNHYVDEVNTLQGDVQSLYTSAELLGNSPATHNAVQQLNAKAATEQRTIQQLGSHAPTEISTTGLFGIIGGPALVVGFAVAALSHSARRAQFKERRLYADLAKTLVTESDSKRPAPTGPLFRPKTATG